MAKQYFKNPDLVQNAESSILIFKTRFFSASTFKNNNYFEWFFYQI